MANPDPSLRSILRLLRIALAVTLIFLLKSLCISLGFAILFSLLLLPICRFLERIRIPRALSALLSILFLFTLLFLILFLVGNQMVELSKQLPQLNSQLYAKLDIFQQWIYHNLKIEPQAQIQWIKANAPKWISNSVDWMQTLSNTAGLIMDFFLLPIYTFFFLLYRDGFKRFFFLIAPSELDNSIGKILSTIQDVIQQYIKGLVSVMAIVAILNTTGLYFVGLEYAFLFGSIAALASLVPYIGMLVGGGLAVLYALLTNESIIPAVGTASVLYGVQLLADNILTPRITGKGVRINALSSLLALLIAGMFLGAGGMILAIPFTAILKVYLDHMPGLRAYGFLIGDELGNREIKNNKN